MCILTQLHSQTDTIHSVTVVTSVYVCDRQYNGEGSFVIIRVLLYRCRLVLPLLSLYTCVCVCEVIVLAAFFRTDTLWRLWRQCYHWHEYGGMKTPLSFPLITWMSICVICLFLSAWSVGKGVRPYCVTVLLLGWWKPNDRWCLREKLMWLEKGCVCVLFPCMSPQGCQQGGTTGPVMRGASMVQPTHWSWGKTNASIKLCSGLCELSLYPC